MSTSKAILQNLAIQVEHEGLTDNIKLLFKFLNCITTNSQWRALVNVRYERHGKMSYQAHIFYYASDELLQITNIGSIQ